MKRVLIAAGGTGGHFYPGLVAAQELKARGWEPLLVVKKNDPAKERLEQAGLACLEVDLVGMPRRVGPALFSFTAKLLGSLRMLSRVARDFKPDLVLGMGGYLTFPVAYGAWRRGVPIALHESNAVLGLAIEPAVRSGPAAGHTRGDHRVHPFLVPGIAPSSVRTPGGTVDHIEVQGRCFIG